MNYGNSKMLANSAQRVEAARTASAARTAVMRARASNRLSAGIPPAERRARRRQRDAQAANALAPLLRQLCRPSLGARR